MAIIESTDPMQQTGIGVRVIRKVETNSWYTDFVYGAFELAGTSFEFRDARKIAFAHIGEKTMGKILQESPVLRGLPTADLIDAVEEALPESRHESLELETAQVRIIKQKTPSRHRIPPELRMGVEFHPTIQHESSCALTGLSKLGAIDLSRYARSGHRSMHLADKTGPTLPDVVPGLEKLRPGVIILGPVEVVPITEN